MIRAVHPLSNRAMKTLSLVIYNAVIVFGNPVILFIWQRCLWRGNIVNIEDKLFYYIDRAMKTLSLVIFNAVIFVN